MRDVTESWVNIPCRLSPRLQLAFRTCMAQIGANRNYQTICLSLRQRESLEPEHWLNQLRRHVQNSTGH